MMIPRCHIATHMVVKILLVVSLITSASFRWTIKATRTALEVALDEFAIGIDGNSEEERIKHGIRLVQNDSRGLRQPTVPSRKTDFYNPTPSITSDCQSPLLQRSLQRIPGYIAECSNSTFYGYVMRDVSNRFLHPSNHSNKTIVVVSENASQALQEIQQQRLASPPSSREELIQSRDFHVGRSFLVDALWYSHKVVAIDDKNDDTTIGNEIPDNVFLLVIDSPSLQDDSISTSTIRRIIASDTTQYAVIPISSSFQQNFGLNFCQYFLEAGYNLQILSSSHAVNGINPYPPNTPLKSVPQIQRFLQHGQNLTANDEEPFQSYLFATRGWELAIPSRKEYVNMTGLGNDHVIDVDKEGIPFRKCAPHNEAEISIVEEQIQISCFGRSQTIDSHDQQIYTLEGSSNESTVQAEVWLGHANLSMLEAACVKCIQQSYGTWSQETACLTRARLASPPRIEHVKRDAIAHTARRTNLLAIEIKGLAQATLRSWPSIRHIMSLESLGFQHLPNYVGMDQPFSVLERNDTVSLPLLWRQNGYEVLQSSTKCHGGIRPTDQMMETPYYGNQVQEMFCFDHDYPHCLGGKSKPQMLLDSVTQFIQRRRYRNEAWAAFISFSEGQEDETKTLIDTLDVPLTNFLSRLARKSLSADQWGNTTVVLFSDDVKTKPALFLKPGRTVVDTSYVDMFITPFDLTGALAKLIDRDSNESDDFFTLTKSEERSKCESVLKFNKKACRDLEGRKEIDSVQIMVPPASILSYYADIPQGRKLRLHTNEAHAPPRRAKIEMGCMCATNVQSWFKCNEKHPWDEKEDFREYFILVDCPEKPMHFEVRMLPNDVLLKRSTQKRKESGYSNATNVNILFLEIDSVSQEYADRHFPKTRELLKQYRMRWNQRGDDFICVDGLCSADFSHQVSLVGANSIPNQVAALAGCLSSSTKDMCGLNEKSIGEVCNDFSQPHYGLRLERVRLVGEQAYWCPQRDTQKVKTPWIFGVLDNRGYINFFGEEFCYESSPYVTQGNVFSRFYQDIESHHVYCRLAERKIALENLTIPTNQRWGVNLAGPCIDGWTCLENVEKSTISLQFIQKMWATYPETPKFAFLNAIAAHDYSFNWEEMTVMAERYDDHLSDFLKGILTRQDSQKTVIFLRSDHGLQRGPMAMDYAQQVEHRRPWTEILVPEILIPSKVAFFENQLRMTTGFDLYNTIRSLLARSNGVRDEEGVPKIWSFDLLSEVVPLNRTCIDAKVDPKLCRRAPIPRDYGVCNVLDHKQVNFCSSS